VKREKEKKMEIARQEKLSKLFFSPDFSATNLLFLYIHGINVA